MSNSTNKAAITILALVSGAALGAVAALLLAPKPGRDIRGKLADFGGETAEKMKRLAREAKFKARKREQNENFEYDGGDAWI